MTVFDLKVVDDGQGVGEDKGVDDGQGVGDGDEHSQQAESFEVELDMLMDAVDGYANRTVYFHQTYHLKIIVKTN